MFVKNKYRKFPATIPATIIEEQKLNQDKKNINEETGPDDKRKIETPTKTGPVSSGEVFNSIPL